MRGRLLMSRALGHRQGKVVSARQVDHPPRTQLAVFKHPRLGYCVMIPVAQAPALVGSRQRCRQVPLPGQSPTWPAPQFAAAPPSALVRPLWPPPALPPAQSPPLGPADTARPAAGLADLRGSCESQLSGGRGCSPSPCQHLPLRRKAQAVPYAARYVTKLLGSLQRQLRSFFAGGHL